MKFSQSQREVFAVDIHNPGPGYYGSHNMGDNDKINQQQQMFLGEDQNTNWGKGQRFKKNHYILNSNPGAGTYNPPTTFNTSKSQKPGTKRLQSSEDSLFKVNAIPSIPSGTQVPGYQEIGDGLLILMKEPKKDRLMENVGPTSYDVNMSQVKKKVQGFQMKEPQQMIKDQDEKPQRPQSVTDFLKLQPLNQYKYNQAIKKEPKEPKDNSKINKSSTSLNLLQQSKDSIINSEYNLELLVLREKNLSKINTDIPPPGFYYDSEKESCLHTKKKPIELQCFDSTVPRFSYPLNLYPSVGDYKIMSIDDYVEQHKPGQIFDKAPKQNTLLKSHKLQTPGVGHYEFKIDLLKDQATAKSQAQISHPAVFGSGSQRFLVNQPDVPGVGSYKQTYNQNKYSEKKKYKNIIIPQNSQTSKENGNIQLELVVQKDEQQENQDFDQRQQAYKEFNKISDKTSSAFKSEVKRFTEQSKKNQLEVGPGSYNVETNIKQRTFNQGKNPQIDKNTRQFYQGQSGVKSVPKRIGPGTYDFDLGYVRKKKIYDIKMH